jgi:hypothetical protein
MAKTSTKHETLLVFAAAGTIKTFWKNNRSAILILLVGFVAGFLWLTGMRFFLAQPKETHYHANFAVYINGQREEFKDFTYYEEVAACTSAYVNNPKGRVHMHDAKNDVIHVHDTRVTYGNFFENIGWALGEDFIATRERVYQNDQTNQVTYILNGERVDSIAPRVIGNLDRLLIWYGPASADTSGQFASVARTAEEVNKYQDPASCGGLGGAGHNSFGSKLKRATFWP